MDTVTADPKLKGGFCKHTLSMDAEYFIASWTAMNSNGGVVLSTKRNDNLGLYCFWAKQ